MATRQQKNDAAERYKNDIQVPISKRLSFAAACGWDSAVVPGSIATAIVSAAASVGMHIHFSSQIDAVQAEIDATPAAIYDLGERLNTPLSSGESTAAQDDLRQAAKTVLARGPDDLRRLTVVFATRGNGVTLRDDGPGRAEPQDRRIDPSELATQFRAIHGERRDLMQDSRSSIDKIMLLLTAGLGYMAWRAKRLSDRREQVALDHYGIK